MQMYGCFLSERIRVTFCGIYYTASEKNYLLNKVLAWEASETHYVVALRIFADGMCVKMVLRWNT